MKAELIKRAANRAAPRELQEVLHAENKTLVFNSKLKQMEDVLQHSNFTRHGKAK
jgi:hypothetical protein